MLDIRIVNLLEVVKSRDIPVGVTTDIAPQINEIFPYSRPIHEGDARTINGNISNFIKSLHDYFDFDESQHIRQNDPRNNPDKWFELFNIKNTNRAIKALADYKAFEEQSLVNQSLILVNKSVVETNAKMVEIAERQNTINGTIAANTRFQTGFMRRQTIVLYFTAAFALTALIISYKTCSIAQLTYDRDTSKSQLELLLKTKDSTIRTLQHLQSQVKTGSLHQKGEKTDSAKVH